MSSGVRLYSQFELNPRRPEVMLEIPQIRTQQGMLCVWSGARRSGEWCTKPLPVHAFRVDPIKFRGQVTVFFFPLWLRLGVTKRKSWSWWEFNVKNVYFQFITQKKVLVAQKHYLKPHSKCLLLPRNPFLAWRCGCLVYSPQILSSNSSQSDDQLGWAVTPNWIFLKSGFCWRSWGVWLCPAPGQLEVICVR